MMRQVATARRASLSRLCVKDGKNGPITSMSSLMFGVHD